MEMIKKIIWLLHQLEKIVSAILKPLLHLYHILTPDYKVTSRMLSPRNKCYCGSKKSYSSCHQAENKMKGIRIIMIKKENIKTGKVKIKFKTDQLRNKFKPGDINPLNKSESYTEIGNL